MDPLNAGGWHDHSKGFSDVTIYGLMAALPPGRLFVDKVNDAIALVRKHTELQKQIIACLEYGDYITTPMERLPPKHMPLYLHYGFNVSKTHYPDPSYIFSDCDAIIVPKYPDSDVRTVPFLLSQYREYLDANFKIVDQSEMWLLYERKSTKS